MRKNSWFGVLIVSLCVLSLAVIYGCGSNPTGGGGGGGASGRPYYGIDSLGDTVKCSMTDTTFSLHFVTGTMDGVTLSGKITHLASGLLSGEITNSSDPDRIPPGETLYAYEITNEVLVIGGGPENQGIIMICPALSNIAPSACTAEGIMIPNTNWIGNLVACMTVELIGSNSYTFEVDLFDVAGAYLDSTSESNYHFTGEKLYKADKPQLFFSPKGMFAGTNGKRDGINWDDGGIAGTMYDSTVSTLEIADGSRTYIGIAFDRNTFDGDDKTNIKAILAESYASTLLRVSSMDVSSGAALGEPMGTIEVGTMNNPSQGIIDALCDRQGDTVPAKMVAYKYTTDKYAVCGFTTLETGPLSFFIIEQ